MMHPIFMLGGIVGYVVACIVYGHLLPALSAPSIIGVVLGQGILMGIGFASHKFSGKHAGHISRMSTGERQKHEEDLRQRYESWSTDALVKAATEDNQKYGQDELTDIKGEIRRRRRIAKLPT